MAQFARPTADASIGTGWTDEAGGTSALYTHIDDSPTSPVDTDYLKKVNGTATTSKFGLGAITDPAVSSGHIIRVRHQRVSAESNTFSVELRTSGGALIATTGTINPTLSTWVNTAYTLTGTEADSITDYTTMQLWVVGTTQDFGLNISGLEFETPNPISFADPTAIAGAEAFGTAGIQRSSADASSIASLEAFGTASIQGSSVEAAGALASGEAFGTPDAIGNRALDPTSIASAEAFDTVTLVRYIDNAGGIASAESVPSPQSVQLVQVVYVGDGIPSGEAVSSPEWVLGGAEQFFGTFDDVRFWKTMTSADQADRAMRELSPTEQAGSNLEMYLQFKEGTGVTAYDTTANAHNGTLVGTTQWVGLEGGTELAGRRKKRVWGIRRQVEGILVDKQRLVYLVNWGQTQSIVPTQGGYPGLASDGDLTNIYDTAPAAGHYYTQLSRGLVRFGSDPTSGGTIPLAFDVQGDVDPVNGYTDKTAEIMRNLVVNEGGLDSVTEIDVAAVLAMAAARPGAVGHVAGLDRVSVASLLNDLAGGVDGWWTFFRDGRWTLGLRLESETEQPEVALTDKRHVALGQVRRVAAVAPAKRTRLSFRPYEVVMDLSAVSGTIRTASPTVNPQWQGLAGQYTQADRFASTPLDREVLDRYKDARLAEGRTYYDLEADARAEAARRQAIDRYKREVLQVGLATGIFEHRVGQPVSLSLGGALNLPDEILPWSEFIVGIGTILHPGTPARRFLVGGVEEESSAEKIVLYLWGRAAGVSSTLIL